VVVSTGDSGTNGTTGSPSTETSVIAVGASTTFRLYAQTGTGAIPFATNKGYLSNNISAISSGGFAQLNPRVPDLVAPGDSGWALCSTNQTLYYDCGNELGAPSGLLDFGGTSESSPLTAGTAALVIQAYRSTHRGEDPSPATVKKILMSSATDLGAPSSEQGAGLVNALEAVNSALSIDDENGRAKARGTGFLVSPSTVALTAEPGQHQSKTFTLTNNGTSPLKLEPELETLGDAFAGQTRSYNFDPATLPTFLNVVGTPRAYLKKTFKVPAGADHLDAAISYLTPVGSTDALSVFMALIDPQGRQAAYSIPQGSSVGYAHVDVVKPKSGTWTLLVWSRPAGTAGSYKGPLQFTWGVENYVKLGNTYPSHLTLAPGASGYVTADFAMPNTPGDLSAAIKFGDSSSGASAPYPAIPVSLRSLVPTTRTGGNFTGILTGGNGRGASPAQTFEFDVPRGLGNMGLVVEAADNGYLLEGYLVDPQGMPLSVQPNQDPADGSPQFAMQLQRANPQPGRWHFVLLQNYTVSGKQTSLPFTARIDFNGAKITAPKLPNDAGIKLSASAEPVTVPIKVTNNGPLTKLYFADARTASSSITQLPTALCSDAATLPGACFDWLLPTQVSTVAFVSQSNVPITMDAFSDVGSGFGVTGSPDIYAKRIAPDTVAAILSAPEVPWSVWVAFPSLIGPYGPAGAQSAPVTSTAYVIAKGFDSAVTSDSGDIWADFVQDTNTFNPLILAPGQSGTIQVTITPDASLAGKTVKGTLYVDTFDTNVTTGDEVVSLPYSYTVTP
jgi:hypothetical protein